MHLYIHPTPPPRALVVLAGAGCGYGSHNHRGACGDVCQRNDLLDSLTFCTGENRNKVKEPRPHQLQLQRVIVLTKGRIIGDQSQTELGQAHHQAEPYCRKSSRASIHRLPPPPGVVQARPFDQANAECSASGFESKLMGEHAF